MEFIVPVGTDPNAANLSGKVAKSGITRNNVGERPKVGRSRRDRRLGRKSWSILSSCNDAVPPIRRRFRRNRPTDARQPSQDTPKLVPVGTDPNAANLSGKVAKSGITRNNVGERPKVGRSRRDRRLGRKSWSILSSCNDAVPPIRRRFRRNRPTDARQPSQDTPKLAAFGTDPSELSRGRRWNAVLTGFCNCCHKGPVPRRIRFVGAARIAPASRQLRWCITRRRESRQFSGNVRPYDEPLPPHCHGIRPRGADETRTVRPANGPVSSAPLTETREGSRLDQPLSLSTSRTCRRDARRSPARRGRSASRRPSEPPRHSPRAPCGARAA